MDSIRDGPAIGLESSVAVEEENINATILWQHRFNPPVKVVAGR